MQYKKIRIIFLVLLLNILLIGCSKENMENYNEVNFEGKEYESLGYPENEFYYAYNGNQGKAVSVLEGNFDSQEDFFDFFELNIFCLFNSFFVR